MPKLSLAPKPHRDTFIKLSDGRRLAYAEFGAEDGPVVFWFHGTPGGRWQCPPEAPGIARELGFRLVGVDRPGIGGSSPHHGRTLLSWAHDIAELADALDSHQFAAIGLSGGGPYVLGCAHELPDRLVCGVSLGGLGPMDGSDGAPGFSRLLSTTARVLFPVRRPVGMALFAGVWPTRPLVNLGIGLYKRYGPQTDRHVFEIPAFHQMFAQDIVNATRRRAYAPVYDIALFGRPWGFSPRDIDVPIRIWHGDVDQIVPLSHSEHLADIIPDSDLVVVPGHGHFAGFVNSPSVFSEIDRLWPNR